MNAATLQGFRMVADAMKAEPTHYTISAETIIEAAEEIITYEEIKARLAARKAAEANEGK